MFEVQYHSNGKLEKIDSVDLEKLSEILSLFVDNNEEALSAIEWAKKAKAEEVYTRKGYRVKKLGKLDVRYSKEFFNDLASKISYETNIEHQDAWENNGVFVINFAYGNSYMKYRDDGQLYLSIVDSNDRKIIDIMDKEPKQFLQRAVSEFIKCNSRNKKLKIACRKKVNARDTDVIALLRSGKRKVKIYNDIKWKAYVVKGEDETIRFLVTYKDKKKNIDIENFCKVSGYSCCEWKSHIKLKEEVRLKVLSVHNTMLKNGVYME